MTINTRKEDAALREYELDFCVLCLPKELAFLEVLTEHLFSCIAEVCGREKYLEIRKKEAPKDFFQKISNAKIETISEMLETAGGDAVADLEQMIEMIYKLTG